MCWWVCQCLFARKWDRACPCWDADVAAEMASGLAWS
ncbi:hypothetical protein COLO4_13215 [Corchorus olitorius]|uniref:Uncharacterized protein n=1 Tax=Corchorus olitorius TaxID=93759 RepID=A0A1R3JXH5_9ROSI|nr:hypothetical protein COLO4_13215 [Corchorus olitorius]